MARDVPGWRSDRVTSHGYGFAGNARTNGLLTARSARGPGATLTPQNSASGRATVDRHPACTGCLE